MLSGLVNAIDRRLRALHQVTEFSKSSQCIFRMEIAASQDHVALTDGTAIRPGDRIIVLHLWNEQIPAFPADGPTLGWALGLSRRLGKSLRELERFLASRPDLADVRAIKAEMTLGAAERREQLLALAAKYGFEPVEAPRRDLLKRLHRVGENILIAMLVLLHNPASFRWETLRRTCTPIFLSRSALRALSASGSIAADPRNGREPPGTVAAAP